MGGKKQFASRIEEPEMAKKWEKENTIAMNQYKTKVEEEGCQVGTKDLLNDKYILVQKGKKNYHLVIID